MDATMTYEGAAKTRDWWEQVAPKISSGIHLRTRTCRGDKRISDGRKPWESQLASAMAEAFATNFEERS